MEELKKISKKELTRIRCMQQLAHHIGYMINNILRRYEPMERYKGRQQLRVILDNIDNRFNSYDCKLNHNGGAIIHIHNVLPRYMRESSVGFMTINYTNESKGELAFRFMKEYDTQYKLSTLHKIRKRLIKVYEFDKKELPKCDPDQYVITYINNNIDYMDSYYSKLAFERYKIIHDLLKDSSRLKLFYPDFRFEDGVMKVYSSNRALFYVDVEEKLIVSLDIANSPHVGYIHRPRELLSIVRRINKMIDEGIR